MGLACNEDRALKAVYLINLMLAGLALSLCACSAPTVKTLRVGNGAEPQGLDPHLTSGVAEHRLISALLEGLAAPDTKTLEPKPAAAASWQVSPDKSHYVFHLRPEARWSNGDQVTAHDFVYAWQRVLTPTLAADYAYMLHCIKNARAYNTGKISDFGLVGVKALDDLTLEVTLEGPNASFLGMLSHQSFYPVHRPTIEAFGRIDQRNTHWTRPGSYVGNGAFILKRWVPNNVIEVVKNELYWDAAHVKLPRVLFYPIDNLLTEERSFRTNLLDFTETIPITKIPVYRRERPDLIRIDPYLGTYFYRVNTKRKPFDDVRVRRAFALALDQESICKHVLTAGQKPAHCLTVPEAAGYTCPASLAFDAAEARRLLAEAGYPNGRGLPRVEILFNTSQDHRMIAETVQQMWKENLNADVSLLNQDWKVYLASQNSLDYQVSRASWIGDYNDPLNFLECFITDGGNNRTGWSSPAYDGLVERASREADENVRRELMAQAEAILISEAPIIPIYYYVKQFLLSPDVLGWQSNVLGYISFKDLDVIDPRPAREIIRLGGRQ